VKSNLRPAVFLDRDGVLNRTTVRGDTPYPPNTATEVEILPGVPEALERLRRRGLKLIVVTNQPDVARGTQTREAVEEISRFLAQRLRLDAVYTCYHDAADACACRKPKPGMLMCAAEEHSIDLSRSFMVGDRWGDIIAGAAAGCVTFLLEMPYSQCQRCSPDHVVADLAGAVDLILRRMDERDHDGGATDGSTTT
jgi:D-glycero-D-manno-heptose 1,7-bisphosphate phosphatase